MRDSTNIVLGLLLSIVLWFALTAGCAALFPAPNTTKGGGLSWADIQHTAQTPQTP